MKEGIVFNLKKFEEASRNKDIKPDNYKILSNYYYDKTDFYNNRTGYEKEFLLMTNEEYNNWRMIYVPSTNLQERAIQNLNANIQTTLNPSSYVYTKPYIYQNIYNSIVGSNLNPAEDTYFLVQNVIAGEFGRALHVSEEWVKNKVNIGYSAESHYSLTQMPNHIIYGISNIGRLEIVENKSNGDINPLRILNYGKERYGALLLLS